MKIYKIAVLGLMATLVAVGNTFAEPEAEEKGDAVKRGDRARGDRPDPAARYAAMDTDGSGGISLAEFKVAHEKRMAAMKERRGDRAPPEGRTPPAPEDIFKRLDKDSDGTLTKDEMRAGMRRGPRGEAGPRGEGGPRGGGGPRGPGA
jgi:hypothetical protein